MSPALLHRGPRRCQPARGPILLFVRDSGRGGWARSCWRGSGGSAEREKRPVAPSRHPTSHPPPCQPITDDPSQIQALLDKYEIVYVYVGPVERQIYGRDGASLDRFRLFMDVAYQNDGVTIYRTRDPASRSAGADDSQLDGARRSVNGISIE